MKKIFLLLFLGVFSSFAQGKPWKDWQISGNCTRNQTQFIENGNALAVILSDYTVNLPMHEEGDGKNARKVCNFRAQIAVPAGMYLESVTQTYAGGIIKSQGTSAELRIKYHIDSLMENPPALVWSESTQLAPEDLDSLFTRTYTSTLPHKKCAPRLNFAIQLNLSAKRKSYSDFVIGGLDSIDADFAHRLVLQPRFKPCR